MRRLLYSPKAYAFVKTDDHQEGVDISDYIVRGNVHRRTGAASTAEIELRNPNKIFTKPGAPFFRPMDPITVFLTRLKDRPIQVFTGYLDTAPYLQLFPGTVTLSATCTLKRLLHTYWDPSLPYVFDGFLREFGWNVDPKSGAMLHETNYAGPTLNQTKGELADGSMGALLFATLRHVGRWDPDTIYIEKLPEGIAAKMAEMFSHLADDKAMQENIETLARTIVGTGSAGTGGGPLAPVPDLGKDGSYTITELVQLALALGLTGDPAAIAAAVAFAESSGSATVVNSIGCVGLWQINSSVHHNFTVEQLKVPQNNGKEMMRISSNGTNWQPWEAFTNGNYHRFLAAAKRALAIAQPLSLAQWQEKTGGRNDRSSATSGTLTGAPPAPVTSAPSPTPRGLDMTAMVERANKLDGLHIPYRFGGGHNTPDGFDPNGMDCSASVAYVLGVPPRHSSQFETWGSPGADPTGVTVYADNIHVWMTIGDRGFSTSEENPRGGPGWVSYNKPYRPGFTVRHLEGASGSTAGAGGATAAAASLPGGDKSGAAAFAGYMNLPGVIDVAEAIGLAGQKSLLNDQPLFPFIQQIAGAALRNFQSMPNGNFFAFFPDYFGGFGHRTPYWLIDDIEILEGGINLTDDYLATNTFIVGDISGNDHQITFADRLLSGGVMDLASALKSGFIGKGGINDEGVLEFLSKYGVRPYKEENPMIRSPYFEAFLAYQKFMELWAKQFATTFQFTFMPELYPGGIVGLQDHGIQCYVEEVMHSFDYESGFTTQAVLSAPAAMVTAGVGVSAGMVRGFDFNESPVTGTR